MPNEPFAEVIDKKVGKGHLIKIPLLVTNIGGGTTSNLKKALNRNTNNRYITFTRSVFRRMKYWVHYLQSASGKSFFMPQFREASHFPSVLASIFDQNKIDLVINHFAGGKDSFQLINAAYVRKIPVLVINHFNNKWYSEIPIRQQVSLASAAAGMSGVDVPGYLRKKFINILNGIDTDYFDPDKVSPGHEPDKPMLLLPARIVREKGHLDLLKVVLALREERLHCSVVFAGRIDYPDFKSELDTFINKNSLKEDVTFTGVIEPSVLRGLYKSSSVVVLPTYHEGMPRVVIEAQSMKTPPVVYNSGGAIEALIPGQTGLLAKRGNVKDLKEKIAELLKNETKRFDMGSKGREYVKKKFSLTAMAKRHENCYSMLIDNNKGDL